MGSQVERTCGKAVAREASEVADCGTGQAVQQLADPVAPHLRMDGPGGMPGERSRPRNPGLLRGEIEPQTSD